MPAGRVSTSTAEPGVTTQPVAAVSVVAVLSLKLVSVTEGVLCVMMTTSMASDSVFAPVWVSSCASAGSTRRSAMAAAITVAIKGALLSLTGNPLVESVYA